MIDVLPAILAHDEDEFRAMILFPRLRDCAATVHIDILDGSLFGAHCWGEPEIVGAWRGLPDIELHIMTERPLDHLDHWTEHVHSVVRAIVHAEITSSVNDALATIRARQLEAGLALCPATPVDAALAHAEMFDRLLVMGVEPGRSGQPFLGEPILAKLRRARRLFPNTRLAVDGGVNLENAAAIARAGVQSLVTSSAIWRHPNPHAACAQLVHII